MSRCIRGIAVSASVTLLSACGTTLLESPDVATCDGITRSTPVVSPTLNSSCTGSKIVHLNKGSDNGKYTNGGLTAGDIVVISASQNPYSYLSFNNIHGTAACPIQIVNIDGQVQSSSGIALSNSTYVIVRGNGTADAFGFRIEDAKSASGVGVNIYERSAHIEVSDVEVTHKTYGFWVKQDADCDPNLQFPNWVIDDVKIHNTCIMNVGQEGMYLGNTSPNGSRAISCCGTEFSNGASSCPGGGTPTVISPKPLRLGNVVVYNNLIEHANRGAIQLSGADQGANQIYQNTIHNVGYELNNTQGGGVILGGYSSGIIHDNDIDGTYNSGVEILGAGLVQIYRNSIANSGLLPDQPKSPGIASVFIDTRTTNPLVPLQFQVCHNTIGVNTDRSVRVYDTVSGVASSGNIIDPQSGTISVVSSVHYSSNCSSLP